MDSVIEKTKRGRSFTTKELVLTAMMTVLIAVCSWIQIPGTVPFTLQTFAVFMTIGLIGGRNGLMSVLVYILLGAVGVPVFGGFTGGLGILLGYTGGYIVGFVFIALICWAAERIQVKNKIAALSVRTAAMIVGLAVCYAFGTFWFMHVSSSNDSPITFGAALKLCVIPFVLIDLIKMAAAIILTDRIKKYARL